MITKNITKSKLINILKRYIRALNFSLTNYKKMIQYEKDGIKSTIDEIENLDKLTANYKKASETRK